MKKANFKEKNEMENRMDKCKPNLCPDKQLNAEFSTF